jgi:hypothetical protein
MTLEFSGSIWYWRGPAPFFFVTVPPEEARALKTVANSVTYGWGMIPVEVRIGKTIWQTSLWPKDGGYIVPIKANVRKAEQLIEGQEVNVQLKVTAR